MFKLNRHVRSYLKIDILIPNKSYISNFLKISELVAKFIQLQYILYSIVKTFIKYGLNKVNRIRMNLSP